LWGVGGVFAASVIWLLVIGYNLSRSFREVTKIEPVTFKTVDAPSEEINTAPVETQAPIGLPSPVPLPSVGLYPDVSAVWDDLVNKRIPVLRTLTIEKFELDLGLLEGREFFPYTVQLKQSQSVIWDVGWCAIDETTLYTNISSLDYEHSIDDQPISQSKFGTKITPNGNHFCFYAFVVIKDWPLGEHTVRTTEIFKTDINDGVTDNIYPAGRKVVEYTVYVNP
jgi:hypothetical protein